MQDFERPEQVVEFIKDAKEAAASVRSELSLRTGADMCMYEGVQWLNETTLASRGPYSIERFARDFNPDSRHLRVTANRITKFLIKVAAATFPSDINAECFPPEGDLSPQAIMRAQITERATGALVDSSGLLTIARDANHARCVQGTAGIGFHINASTRALDMGDGQSQTVNDQTLTAFTFSPTQLILDPFVTHRDLHLHEFVILVEAMTVAKIKRLYDIDLNPDELQTIGQLTPTEQEFNTLSNGRLYAKYRMHSRTKAALVYQMHCKTPDGRFGRMYVWIETPNQKAPLVPIAGDSPFGGDGMPLFLLHGHRRADSPWSIGDVATMRDEQDRLNLVMTQLFRQVQKNAGWQWLVSDESMKADDQNLHNTVAGVVRYKTGSRDRPVPPPQLVQHPPPQPVLMEMAHAAEQEMREQSHRSEANFGGTKSHVPDATFQRAIDEADQVLGIRIKEDIGTYERMLTVGCGTLLRLAQEQSPSALASLANAGFGADEFAVVASLDPSMRGYTVTLRESSVRHRSDASRKEDINAALLNKAITPLQYRAAMASDLDTPIVNDDGFYVYQAQKAAARIVAGEEWAPAPLGDYAQVFIGEFRKSRLSDAARLDPSVAQRLDRAIISQMAMGAREQMLAQPPVAASGAGGPQTTQTEPSGDLESLLARIDSQVGVPSGSAQPGLESAA